MNIDLSSYVFFKEVKETSFTLLPQQGFSNKNYTFHFENKTYLLRKFILQDRDRALEYQVQTLTYEKGLAAKPVVLDLEKGLMICEFLEGSHKESLEREDLQKIVSLLKKLHTIHHESEPLQMLSLFDTVSPEIAEAFSTLGKYPKEIVLCHNDLNPKNIIFNNKNVKLIDWEFAANNDLYFDLATVSVEFKLSTLDEAYMLAFYFQKEGWEKEKMEAYKAIYKALCTQWFNKNL